MRISDWSSDVCSSDLLLAGVRLADDLAAARAMLPMLGAGEAIITRHGEWIGAGWLRVARSGEAKQGALAREREIQSLRAELAQLGERETQLGNERTELPNNLAADAPQREGANSRVYHAPPPGS